MYNALLAGSPLLSLTLLALLIFVGVFVAVVIRTMLAKPSAYATIANLPLAGEDEARHDC